VPPAGFVLIPIWVGAAAVVLMWLVHTPGRFAVAADYAVAVARLTGLLTGYGVVVLIALMARIPAVERTAGADRLSRWHALGGRYIFLLLVVHIGSVLWGYARSSRIPIAREAGILLRDYPDVVLAAVAAALFVGVALTSARAVRRAVGYEAWYFLHLLTYVAVALAFSHQFANGTDFVYDAAARVAWACLYLAVGTAVLYFRVIRPIAGGMRRNLTVQKVVQEAGGAVSISVHGRHVNQLGAESGQFFRLRFLARGLWLQSHPFSLSAAPTSDVLRFTVKPVGDHTRELQHLAPGTRVVAEGPFGTVTARRRSRRKVLLIAGGIGITPIRALFESMPADRGELTLIYRCRTEAELTFRSELADLARARDASVIYLVGRTQDIGLSMDDQSLLALVPDLAEHDVFICAPTAMSVEVTAALRACGVPTRNIHRESFEFAAGSPALARQAVAVSLTFLGIAAIVAVRSDLVEPARGRSAMDAVALAGVAGSGPAVRPDRPSGPSTVTVVGSLQRTLYTNVQVAAVLKDGRLVDVRALRLPDVDARSRQISAMAAPILRREAIAAGSAHIDTVSGATYTSEAYAQSLQAALDAGR
jgi:predicted ferric reductase